MVQLRKALPRQRLGSSWRRVRSCTNRSAATRQPEGTGRRKLVQMLQTACLLHKQLLAIVLVNQPRFSCALPPSSTTAIQPPAMGTCTEHTARRSSMQHFSDCSGHHGFKFEPRHRPLWPRFLVFSCPSRPWTANDLFLSTVAIPTHITYEEK